MLTILNSPSYPSDWLKGESHYGEFSSRDTAVLAAGQGVLVTGTVLGQRTADGSFAVYAVGATDGTQTAVAILFDQAVDTTNGPQPCVVVSRDATVMHQGLVWGPTVNTPQLRAAAAQQLKAQNIIDRQGA